MVMSLRIIGTAGNDEMQAKVAEVKALAEKAEATGQNARQMVLNDRERNASTIAELRTAAAQLPTTQQAAAEAHMALQAQIDSLLQQFTTARQDDDETHAALVGQVGALAGRVDEIELTPGPPGRDGRDGIDGRSGTDGRAGADGASAYELARQQGYGGTLTQWLASLKGDAGAPGTPGRDGQAIKGDKGDKGDRGDAGTPADMTRVATLEAAVAALQALKVTVGYGVANLPASLAAGATSNVVVTLSRDMGTASYSVGYGLAGGTSLLGSLQAVGVTAQTRTTVTVQMKNTGLTGLANLSTASLSVVAARDA